MTTRFSAIAKDWNLTEVEKAFLSDVVIWMRKGNVTIGGTPRKPVSLEAATDAVRFAAYEADRQYHRWFHPAYEHRMHALDAAANLMDAVAINYSRIDPILRYHAEKKKNGVLK
jgi:hypothetical protein